MAEDKKDMLLEVKGKLIDLGVSPDSAKPLAGLLTDPDNRGKARGLAFSILGPKEKNENKPGKPSTPKPEKIL